MQQTPKKVGDRLKRKKIMANKKAILLQLAEYFADKGSMMTPVEYKAADDAPIRFMVAKRPFGSWARMQGMIKSNYPSLWMKTQSAPAPAPKAAPKPKAATAKAAAPKAAKK